MARMPRITNLQANGGMNSASLFPTRNRPLCLEGRRALPAHSSVRNYPHPFYPCNPRLPFPRLLLRWRDPQSHRNHRGFGETVFAEKRLRHIFRPIGQQRDSEKIFLLREINGVFEEFVAVSLALILLMDHEIL